MPNAWLLAGELVLQHQRALAGRRVDAIDVGGRALVVGDVAARVAADGPAAVRRHVELAHRLIGELDELRAGHVERLAEGEVAICVGADHLHATGCARPRVPDVDVGDARRCSCARPVSGAGTCSFMPKNTRLLSSLQSSVARSLTTQPFGKPAAFAGIEHDRRGLGARRARPARWRTRCSMLSRSRILSTSMPLSTASAAAVVAPREAVVDSRVVVERVDAAVAQVEHEQAVAVLHRGVDGVGEQLARLVERDVADAAEQLIASGREVVEDDVDAARARPASPRRRRAARRRHRRRAAGATAAASRAPAPPRVGRPAPQDQMRRVRRERERLDVLPRLHRAGREIAQLDASSAAAAACAAPPRPAWAPAARPPARLPRCRSRPVSARRVALPAHHRRRPRPPRPPRPPLGIDLIREPLRVGGERAARSRSAIATS